MRRQCNENHRAGQAALRLLGVVRRRRHLARHLLQEVEPPPDCKVEEGEHDERQEAGQAHLEWRVLFNLLNFELKLKFKLAHLV